MRAAVLVLLLSGCGRPPEAQPPPNDQLRMALVYGAPGEEGLERVVSIQTWARPAPAPGEHWTIVDAEGFVADVVITEPEPGDCDHCPTHRMLARVTERRRDAGTPRVALGPATGPLRHARVTRSNGGWHGELTEGRYVFELEIDADGDGRADLARWVRGSRVEYEIRARVSGRWIARERWLTDDILDVNDVCPDAPDDGEPEAGCPPPAP